MQISISLLRSIDAVAPPSTRSRMTVVVFVFMFDSCVCLLGWNSESSFKCFIVGSKRRTQRLESVR